MFAFIYTNWSEVERGFRCSPRSIACTCQCCWTPRWCHCYLVLKQTPELRRVSPGLRDHRATCFILKSRCFKNQWASAANYGKSLSRPISRFCIFPTCHATFAMGRQHGSVAISHGHPPAPLLHSFRLPPGRTLPREVSGERSLPYHTWIPPLTSRLIRCCIFWECKKIEAFFSYLKHFTLCGSSYVPGMWFCQWEASVLNAYLRDVILFSIFQWS